MEWQPIETAPRDGQEVDLWGQFLPEGPTGRRIPECKMLGQGWYTRGEYGWQSLADIGFKPTHWLPLPKGPNQ